MPPPSEFGLRALPHRLHYNLHGTSYCPAAASIILETYPTKYSDETILENFFGEMSRRSGGAREEWSLAFWGFAPFWMTVHVG